LPWDERVSAADDAPSYSEFYDPRLVAIFDTMNPFGDYHAFYLKLAARLSASLIIDIGCGSGTLTCALANQGHQLIGIEPSSPLIERARQRPHCQGVQWIEGGAAQLGDFQADLAIMTGHVAQFFLDDDVWQAALIAIHRALKPGGRIAFESRNPAVQPWFDNRIKAHVDWPSQTSARQVVDPVAGQIQWWIEFLAAHGSRVRYDIHYLFVNSGEELISDGELVFRSQDELRRSLAQAGFSIENVYGDWDGRTANTASPEYIFVAKRD
jgi:SAM-dependent methyltransferase